MAGPSFSSSARPARVCLCCARRAAREPLLLNVDGPRIGALRCGIVPRGDMECQEDDEGGGLIAGRFVAAAGGTRRRIVGRRERSGRDRHQHVDTVVVGGRLRACIGAR
jgi:hypothetical protein